MSGDFRHSSTHLHAPIRPGPVVAFDFDGTLTCRDSFVSFFRWRAGRAAFAAGVASLVPDIARHMIKPDRGKLKAAMARRFLGRISRRDLEAEARNFAEVQAQALLRPDAVDCWRDWRARGARLYVVTASPETLVAPFAERLGADGLIGTKLKWDAEDRYAGVLDGSNCRGAEKVARLKSALGTDLFLQAAYGDSAGDTELLAFAKQGGMRVFAGRP
jgi:phosphatidylglycerophosphatase C